MSLKSYLLLLLFFANCFFAYSQKQPLRFDHLGRNEGLTQSNVTCIMQDSRGFMWFGTQDGLNKYDGYLFLPYKNIPGDSTSIANNYITGIIEDARGNLWVATWGGGIEHFDRNKERFTHYRHNTNNANTLSDDFVTSLVQTRDGNIWAGTQKGGLNRLNPATGKFTHYMFNKNDAHSISDNFVVTLYEDSHQHLWAGTLHGGLNLLNANGAFTRYQQQPNNPASLSHNSICKIFEDSQHRLWIGTRGGGLNEMDEKTGAFRCFKNDPNNPNSLPINVVFDITEDDSHRLWIGTQNGGLSILNPVTSQFNNYAYDDIDEWSLNNNSIYSIYKDRQGNMWVGTYSSGINLYSKGANTFAHFRHTTEPNSLSHNKVLGICESANGHIWLGTDGGGVNEFDPQTKLFTHHKHRKGDPNSICGDVVIALCEDIDRNLWMGTCEGGITVYNPQKKTYRTITHNPNNPNSVAANNVCTILQDADKDMWIGTYDFGLDCYNIQTGHYTHYRYDSSKPNTISNDRIACLMQDRKGNIWIGTFEGGVDRLDKKTGVITRFMHTDGKNSLSNNRTYFLYEDKQGNILIGTNAGLNCYNPYTNQFTVYNTSQGLPGNIIVGMAEDTKCNLWLSTNFGLCRFNILTKQCKNFTAADGLQSNEFAGFSAFKSRAGCFYFGGLNGFNEFFPDSIKQDRYQPPLVFTSFQLFNKDVSLSHNGTGDSPLTLPIAETKAITLPYSSSVISFIFSSLNYTNKKKNQYAYRLKGFDKNWNYIGTRHTATYTNLDPGTYVLEVKALINDGEWNSHITSMQLTILPPFWLTVWFRLLCAFVGVSCIVVIYRWRVSSIKKHNAALEVLVQKRTNQLALSIDEEKKAREDAEKARQEAEQANKAKSVFLATMSHEIRTPMNGVIGMASLLSQTPLSDEQRSYTETIQTCGENLLTVINDILDFSKIESGKLELEEKEFNLRTCIEEVLDIFATKASQTGLDLIYQIEHNVPGFITGDSTRLKQILINLVGNAIKFTHKGEVFVRVYLMQHEKNNTIQLGFEVRDIGIGIPEDKLERLFKAFSQVDSSTTRKYGGTGLGLVICEKLIKLMGGYIEVESTPGKGSVFAFTINTKVATSELVAQVLPDLSEVEGKRILVVDDNATNRKILKLQLEQWNLQTVLADSAHNALELLTSEQPFDLVLTDMHMPEMNGLGLAKEVRSRYPSLPIMLLSSVCDDEYKQHRDLFSVVLTKPIKQQQLLKNILNNFSTVVNIVTEKEPARNTVLTNSFSQENPLQILLAEDNPFNQALANAILGKLGYQYDLAENGEQVLSMMANKTYDVILMDIQMPEMDGLEATRLIRKQTGHQPVIIAMTANAMQEDREECIQAGMDDYLSKPIKPEDLVAVLKKWAVAV